MDTMWLVFVLITTSLMQSRGIKLSVQSQAYVSRLIEMWLKNPRLMPNRITGRIIFDNTLPEESGYHASDVILWDPITEFNLVLICPHCSESAARCSNQLHASRWKDGKVSYDEPRKLYCIQRQVILVSRVYRCSAGHHVLAHDPWVLQETHTETRFHIPFILFHKSGVTRDLFLYIFTHVQTGVKLNDIENLISQMYTDAHCSTQRGLSSTLTKTLETPGRPTITNCFVRAYFEFEHMYAQHMSDIPFSWLSADHTFKVSANIGFWHRGIWVKQYNSLFCVLNEIGQVVSWRLTKGTSFDKVRSCLTDIKYRLHKRKRNINQFYIDNCCTWQKKLRDVFGEHLQIKLDLFHAVKRVTQKIPKRSNGDNVLKLLRQRMISDLRHIFRRPSDIGKERIHETPTPNCLVENLDNFLRKWGTQKHGQFPILPKGAIEELSKLRAHMEKGCLSGIPPSGGTNRNEALHKTLRKIISRQRIGIQLALALLGITFYFWNEKKCLPNKKDTFNRSIQKYYTSFLAKGEERTTSVFGLSLAENKLVEGKTSDVSQYLPDTLPLSVDEDINDYDETDSDDCNANEGDVESISTLSQIVNTVICKATIIYNLSGKTNTNPLSLGRSIHFTCMRTALSKLVTYGDYQQDVCSNSNKVDELLKAHGLQRLPVEKDGNCLFSSVFFYISQILATSDCGLNNLRGHLNSIGISRDNDAQEVIATLRKLVVEEFLGNNLHEYSSFLSSKEHSSYEEIANNFLHDGFFDCELGNAVILALSNVLHVSFVIFTSFENFPVITIVPRCDTLSEAVPGYLVYEHVGAGHYDAVIENANELSDSATNASSATLVTMPSAEISSQQTCRCGKGAAKNKQDRQFCSEYKSGCKCFQNLKSCTSACACFNCGNTFGPKPNDDKKHDKEKNKISRKRRKHTAEKESGRHFMLRRGESVASAPWLLLEELLCIECALHFGGIEDENIENVTDLYNRIIPLVRGGTLTYPENTSRDLEAYLQVLERKEIKFVRSLLRKIYDESKVLELSVSQERVQSK